MKIHKKHFVSLLTASCLLTGSTALAAEPNIPNPVKNDAGIQMNRMRDEMERERVRKQIAEDRAAAENKVEDQQKA